MLFNYDLDIKYKFVISVVSYVSMSDKTYFLTFKITPHNIEYRYNFTSTHITKHKTTN